MDKWVYRYSTVSTCISDHRDCALALMSANSVIERIGVLPHSLFHFLPWIRPTLQMKDITPLIERGGSFFSSKVSVTWMVNLKMPIEWPPQNFIGTIFFERCDRIQSIISLPCRFRSQSNIRADGYQGHDQNGFFTSTKRVLSAVPGRCQAQGAALVLCR